MTYFTNATKIKNMKLYIEPPERTFGGLFSDEVYAEAIRGFVIDCTDFVTINRERRTLLLPKRIVESAEGIWRFGGRRRAGESMQDSCVRIAIREIGLTLALERFTYVNTTDNMWAWRLQEPKEAGCHTIIHLHSIELTPEELQAATTGLNSKEYDASFGIQEFGYADLLKANVRPQILDMYTSIFGAAS